MMRKETYEIFIKAFNDLATEVHENARAHGWHDRDRHPAELIALMHSELSEALEAARHGNQQDDHIPEYDGMSAEFADTIIRIMEASILLNLRVSEAIIAKHEYNKNRPYMHGGKKF